MAKVKEATELLCVIPNKPGSVARIAQAVSETRTNIVAMISCDQTYCKMVTSNNPKAAQAIKKLGYDISKNNVLIVDLPNRVGAFYPLAQKIAEAGININYHYATTSGPKAQVVLSTNNDSKTRRIIRRYR
jgi:hypothetical protein